MAGAEEIRDALVSWLSFLSLFTHPPCIPLVDLARKMSISNSYLVFVSLSIA